MMGRLTEETLFVVSIPCDERAAAAAVDGSLGGTNGWIDATGYDEATMLVTFGAIAAGVTPLDCELYENDANSGAGALIANAKIVQAAGGDEDNQAMSVNVRLGGRAAGTRKKYVRPKLTSGGTGNYDATVLILLSKPKVAPVVNTPVSVNV